MTVMPNFGAFSECGKLRSVLLHRPGPEIEAVMDAREVLWLDLLDAEKAREQHDALVEICYAHKVSVNYMLDTLEATPNLYFVRDTYAMTPVGAILSRPALGVRTGEEQIAGRTLTQLGVPIVLAVDGGGTFEGGDLMIINEDLAFIAQGTRTNMAGAAQVKALLRAIGIGEVVQVDLSDGCMHLDCALSIVNRDLALLYPQRMSSNVREPLERHGFQVIAVPEMESKISMAINMVALEPGRVMMPAHNPITKKLLEEEGITCIEVDVSELRKGEGGIHCMVGVLQRDAI
jgi:N-dimethylarginine dimethylaminohydrolase